MPLYTAFNLNFQSEFPLPELLPGGSVPDVIIRHGTLGKAPDAEGPIRCEWAEKNEALLSWGQVGLVLVRDGTELIVDPAPGADEDAMRLLLTGAAFAILLHQRGLIVLHSSAVLIHGQVVAFIGDKGAGKSSTAAALCARGNPLITDDLLVIRLDETGKPFVLFGYPQLKIWPDTAEVLGLNVGNLSRVHSNFEKRAHRPDYSLARPEYPLKSIYVLGTGETTEIVSLPADAAFFALIRNVYVTRFGKKFYQPGMFPQPFQQVASLIKATSVQAIRRKVDLSALPQLAQIVESVG